MTDQIKQAAWSYTKVIIGAGIKTYRIAHRIDPTLDVFVPPAAPEPPVEP